LLFPNKPRLPFSLSSLPLFILHHIVWFFATCISHSCFYLAHASATYHASCGFAPNTYFWNQYQTYSEPQRNIKLKLKNAYLKRVTQRFSRCGHPPPPPSSMRQHGITCVICTKEDPNVSSAQASKAATPISPGNEWGWYAEEVLKLPHIPTCPYSAGNDGCGCVLTLTACIANSTLNVIIAWRRRRRRQLGVVEQI